MARTASVAENEEDRARRKNEERKKRREKRERSKNRKDALAPGPEIQTEIQNIQEGLPPEQRFEKYYLKVLSFEKAFKSS